MATSSPAHHAPSPPAASTTDPRALSTAIADHVARTVDTLQRRAAEVLSTFSEPRAADLTRAHRLRVRFAEAVTGFALGQAVRRLLTGLRRGLGADTTRAVRARLELALTSATGDHADRRATLATLELANEHRVTVALGEELRARFGQLAPRLTAVVEAVHDELARLVPARADELVAMLDLVARDPTLEERLADELRLGWPVLVALLRSKDAAISTPSPLWAAWLSLARGQRTPEALTPHDYILVVR